MMNGAPRENSLRDKTQRWSWLWLPTAFFIMCSGWAITSAVGSSPDDDFHLASIWCGSGERENACVDTGLTPPKFVVSAGAVNAAFCFATDSKVTGECTESELNSEELILTERLNNVQNLYPSAYYRVLSVFVGPDVERSVYIMRIFNVLLVSSLLGLLIRVSPAGIRQATLLTLAATFTPLGIFLVASTNPSGWAAAGCLFFVAFGLALMNRDSWRTSRTWLLAGGTVISGFMAIGSRVDASLFIAGASLILFVLSGTRAIRTQKVGSIVLASVAVLGVITYLSVTPLANTSELGTSEANWELFWNNVINLPQLVQGILGSWPLGWNDTPLPPIVSVIGLLVLGGLIVHGLSQVWNRKLLAVGIAFALFLAFPLTFMQTQGVAVGEVIQSRYLLPLLAIVIFVVLVPQAVTNPIGMDWVTGVLVGVGIVISSGIAFWANAHRYSTGSNSGLFDVDIAWTFGPPLFVTAVTVLIASIIFVYGVLMGSMPKRVPGEIRSDEPIAP